MRRFVAINATLCATVYVLAWLINLDMDASYGLPIAISILVVVAVASAFLPNVVGNYNYKYVIAMLIYKPQVAFPTISIYCLLVALATTLQIVSYNFMANQPPKIAVFRIPDCKHYSYFSWSSFTRTSLYCSNTHGPIRFVSLESIFHGS